MLKASEGVSVQPVGKQAAAVESLAPELLVVAPPGCGKTELLAMRAEHLVRAGTILPGRKLLAITYSKRARDSMAVRIQERLGRQLASKYVTVANFHGLAGRVVAAHRRTIGLADDVSFPSKRWLSKAMGGLSDDWAARASAEARLREIKSGPLTDDMVAALLVEPGDELAAAVEAIRIRENHLDYPDILRHAQNLLRNPGIARLYQQHFGAVLVDEFQDMSLQQLDIVDRVSAGQKTFVGDPLQGIYSWAGADPDRVQADLESRNLERIDLDVSYRSSPEVLDLVNAIAVPLGAQALSAADPDRWGDRGRSRAHTFADDQAEAQWIAGLAKKLVDEHPDESLAVISRRGSRRAPVDRAVAALGVTAQVWDMALDVPGLVSLLKQAARRVAVDLTFSEQLTRVNEEVLEIVGDDDVETLAELEDALALLSARSHEGDSVRDVLARVREVDVAHAVGPGVHLLNAHVGKGQQFDWVVVIGLEQGHVPDFRSPDDPEEQRVFMVMLSRAKKGLIVTRARKTTTKYGLRTSAPSQWWEALQNASQEAS